MGFKDYSKYKDGVYISVDIDSFSTENINKYIEDNLKDVEHNTSLHCTLIYSKKPLNRDVKNEEYEAIGTFKKFSLLGPNSDVLVIELDCDKLTQRNKELVEEYDFVSDFGEYKPHITLAYKIPKDFDIDNLPVIDFKINFINEHTEPLDIKWSNK